MHFEHLRRAGGGVLVEAAGFEQHIEQLSAVLRGDDGFAERNRSFLEAFVRPHGLEQPAAPVLADALERAAAAGPRPRPSRGLAEAAARRVWRAIAALQRAKVARRPKGKAAAAAAKAARGERKARKAQRDVPTEVRR